MLLDLDLLALDFRVIELISSFVWGLFISTLNESKLESCLLSFSSSDYLGNDAALRSLVGVGCITN